MKPGQTVSISGYDLLFDGMSMRQGPNYRDLVVSRSAVAAMSSAATRRTFPSRSNTRTEAALMARGLSQLYVSLATRRPPARARCASITSRSCC